MHVTLLGVEISTYCSDALLGEDNALWELGCFFGIDELSVFLLAGRTCSATAGLTA